LASIAANTTVKTSFRHIWNNLTKADIFLEEGKLRKKCECASKEEFEKPHPKKNCGKPHTPEGI
jgi:hypothetical protein